MPCARHTAHPDAQQEHVRTGRVDNRGRYYYALCSWVGTDVPCSEEDKQLFRVSTRVTAGNGSRAKFWESTWLNGVAPRDLAPNLYKLAWRKNITVKENLENNNWTRGLWRMSTGEEIAEMVVLGALVREVQLTDGEDEIVWRWTTDGIYTSKSAYNAQLTGSYCTFDANAIWRSKRRGNTASSLGCWCRKKF